MLTRAFPIDKAFPNASDLRKEQAGIYPREGVFPDATTIATTGVAYASGGWNVGARPFVANLKRGGAPFSQTYGAAQVANDAAVAAAWTLPGAPSSGSITSLLWVRADDPTAGETVTQVGDERDAQGNLRPRAVAVFGVTTGTTTVAPILPAGAELIATTTIASTSTSAATSTIIQAYDFAGVVGGVQVARTLDRRNALAAVEGEAWYTLETKQAHQYLGAALGWLHLGGKPDVGVWTSLGIYVPNDASRPVRAFSQGGRVSIEGNVVSNISANFVAGEEYPMGQFPAEFGIKVARTFWVDSNGARMLVRVYPTGVVAFRPTSSFTGVLNLSLDGLSWVDKRLS